MVREYLSIYDQIPGIENLNLGITTRVLAKRLHRMSLEQQTVENTPTSSRKSSLSTRERRPSKFLSGAAIPNSIIKADLKLTTPPVKTPEQIRKERDEFVAEIIKRLQPQERLRSSLYDETIDLQALAKIREELLKKSFMSKEDLTDTERNVGVFSTKRSDTNKRDPWQEIKEKRRISRRTSILAPLGGERRPTYESIQKAIQNSKIIQQLIDADNIEMQKIKQIQTGKSLIHSENSITPEKQYEKTSATKIEKKASRRSSIRRKYSQRSSSDKSRHSLGNKTSTKHIVYRKDSKAKSSILKSDASTILI